MPDEETEIFMLREGFPSFLHRLAEENAPDIETKKALYETTPKQQGPFERGDRVRVVSAALSFRRNTEGSVIRTRDRCAVVKFYSDGAEHLFGNSALVLIPRPSTENYDNPNCTTCGTHLGIPYHLTQEHSMALELDIELARD